MTTSRTTLLRLAAFTVFAVLAVRTAWLNVVLPPNVDGTPIMSLALFVLCPIALVALCFLVSDLKRLIRERAWDWLTWASAAAELSGIIATAAIFLT